MDEINAGSPSQPPLPNAAATSSVSKRNSAGLGRVEKHCMSFVVSLGEGLGNVKALLLRQSKKLTAKDEKEATEADLRTSKMQVEDADVAEDAKMRIQNPLKKGHLRSDVIDSVFFGVFLRLVFRQGTL